MWAGPPWPRTRRVSRWRAGAESGPAAGYPGRASGRPLARTRVAPMRPGRSEVRSRGVRASGPLNRGLPVVLRPRARAALSTCLPRRSAPAPPRCRKGPGPVRSPPERTGQAVFSVPWPARGPACRTTCGKKAPRAARHLARAPRPDSAGKATARGSQPPADSSPCLSSEQLRASESSGAPLLTPLTRRAIRGSTRLSSVCVLRAPFPAIVTFLNGRGYRPKPLVDGVNYRGLR